jgi:hypothetical protein
MDEAHPHPVCDECGLTLHDRLQHVQRWNLCVARLRVVTLDDVVQQLANAFVIPTSRKILERSYADMACGDAGQHRPR